MACDKLFCRECFGRLRFPVGKITEDAYIAVDLFPEVPRVVVDLQPLYYYRLRENSISTKRFSEKDYDTIEAYTRCLSIVREKYPECIDAAQMRYIWSRFFVYDKMVVAHEPGGEKIRKELIRSRKMILGNPYIFSTRKLGFVVLFVSRSLYRRFVIWYENRINERALS